MTSYASVQATAQPVALFEMGGGMPVPGGLRNLQIQILDDGSASADVVSYDQNFKNENAAHYDLPAMTPTDFATLKNAIAGLSRGVLESDNGQPRCEDAPSMVYSIVSKAQTVIVSQTIGCVTQELNNSRARARAAVVIGYLRQYQDDLSKLQK
jgi:hypothetical protein